MPSIIKRNTIQEAPFIIALSMVKNEEDIIEPFIRHNLEYIDLFCVIDNGSFDNTRTILRKMQKEGLPLVVLDDPIKAYNQEEKMTRFCKQTMLTLFPDYIFFLDADEFIKCNSKNEFLKEINKIPPKGKGFIDWQSYITNQSKDKDEDRKSEFKMLRRLKNEQKIFRKIVFRPDGKYLRNIVVSQGNHNINGVENQIQLTKLKIAHYPIRSTTQLIEKVISGWMAYLIKSPRARYKGQGFHWLKIFDKIKNGIDNNQTIELSANYSWEFDKNWKKNIIDDPLQVNFSKLKYLKENKLNSISKLARLIEENLAEKDDAFIIHLKDLISEQQNEINSSNVPINGQIFNDNWHWENLFLDIPPFEYFSRKHQPKSVLDVGCGIGLYLDYFKFHGAKHIKGIDGISSSASILDSEEYISMDLSNNFALNKKYDLVVCLETVEHLDYNTALRVIRNLSDHAKDKILFSAAELGQPGIGHINCQPIEYWIERWAELGWTVNELDTISFRMLSTFSWFKRNVLVLNKSINKSKNNNFLLEKIGQKNFQWWNQEPKIVKFPLQEDIDQELSLSNNSSVSKYTKMQLKINLSGLKKTKNIIKLNLSDKKFEFYAVNEDPIIFLPKINYKNLNATAIRIKIIAPEKTIMQIFYKTSNFNTIYSEENSLHIPLEVGENDKYIKLPNKIQFKQLRIDPGINSGYYVIEGIDFWR